MGNARGTKNSRAHEHIDPDNPKDKNEFFDFSYEEIGLFDVAEMVDYVLVMTRKRQLNFIGYGAGGTAFLALNSLWPEYNEKFNTAHLLATPGYQRNFRNVELLMLAKYINTYYVSIFILCID